MTVRSELRQFCRNLVTLRPFHLVPMVMPKAEPQGNAMSSVRITAAGAVAVAALCYFTAPASACDERYVKRCEKLSAAAMARGGFEAAGPVAKRKSAGRVRMVFSVRSKHGRLLRRTRAPGFSVARAERGSTVLASDSTRMTTLMPESALARRFRGFIAPLPIAQNAFETLRKPHLVALNLDASPAMPAGDVVGAPAAKPDTPDIAAVDSAPALAKQDRIAAKAPVAEPAETRGITLTAPLTTRSVALADTGIAAAPAPAAPIAPQTKPQTILTEAPAPLPPEEQPSRFSVHQLVLALCGALGAAGALRFIVGA